MGIGTSRGAIARQGIFYRENGEDGETDFFTTEDTESSSIIRSFFVPTRIFFFN